MTLYLNGAQHAAKNTYGVMSNLVTRCWDMLASVRLRGHAYIVFVQTL